MRDIVRWFCAINLLAAGALSSAADTQDDFKSFRLQRQQAAEQSRAEFQDYKRQQDSEFADFLKTQWREFQTFKGKVRIKEPKPKQVPVAPAVIPPAPPAAPVIPKPSPEVKVEPEPVKPVPETPKVLPLVVVPVAPPPLPPQPKPVPVAANIIEISFYGNPVSFSYDPQWRSYRMSGAAKPEAMSAFWTMMSESKYEPAIKSVNDARHELKLDDWGYVTLWREVARTMQPGRSTEQNLLLWYFLVKSGFDARLGYSGNNVYLFVAVRQQVYATKYTTVGNQTYYAVLAEDRGNSMNSFYTYDASYPGKLNPLDIHSASTGFTRTVPVQRELAFEYEDKIIKLNIPYDRRLVEYLGTFPQSEFELYFDTDGSSLIRKNLLAELRNYTAKMDQEEAVNFLLDFVQNAFAYKTDDAQFGYEKYFFVEESLHYPYNDCEDRSVIFAWLVHELLGIKVVGLVYPGHMTTAVAIKPRSGFSTVDYQGQKMVIADPTYIGALVGMAMPSYEKLQPKRVVEIQY